MAAGNPRNQRFGAHMSIAGGIHNAFDLALEAGCDCLQIFVKNQRQWTSPRPLSDDDVRLYKSAARRTGIRPVVAHATYLINLGSPDDRLWRRSIDALVVELERCQRLSIRYLVVHPGAHMGQGEEFGINRIAQALDDICRRTAAYKVGILLETTAGQGSSIGHRFEHLRQIIDQVADAGRVNVCLDTCHVFAAGYPMRTERQYADTMNHFRRVIGCKRLKVFHVNDSVRECGSRVDRHAHIGKGKIGKGGFAHLVNDSRFYSVPKILETPKGVDGRGRDWDRINLKRLRDMIAS